MASPLRVPDEAAELETAKEVVLALVQDTATSVAPSELFAAMKQKYGVPVALAQLAMWELLAHNAIEFTSDYRLHVRR